MATTHEGGKGRNPFGVEFFPERRRKRFLRGPYHSCARSPGPRRAAPADAKLPEAC